MSGNDRNPSVSRSPSPPVVFGLWPLAGVTTIGVTEADADASMAAALDGGLRAFDTAFSYGFDGESDRLLRRHLASPAWKSRRDEFTIIGKAGQRWAADGSRVVDASPATLAADTETSLRRIGIERFDMLMLHSPDPNVPIETSAEAMGDLVRRGLAKRVGVCNMTEDQLRAFSGAVDCSSIQCPLNLLQPDALESMIPTATSLGCEVDVFWTLMKGLLAGRIERDHVFADGDSRPKYPIFQGAARSRAHDVVDGMRLIASETGKTVAQLAIGWAASQRGVTAALVGARRPDQVIEIAEATRLDSPTIDRLNQLTKKHGE